MFFLITEDREPIKTEVKGIALDFQATFPEMQMAGKVGLKWRAVFSHIDLDGQFELWLTTTETRQLIARLQTAIGDTPSQGNTK